MKIPKVFKVLGLFVVAAGVLGVAYTKGLIGAPKKPANPLGPIAVENREKATNIPVSVADFKTQTVRKTIAAVGSLHGREEVPIYPKVEGRVRKIFFDIGDRVKPGDVLIELEPTDYELAKNEADSIYRQELAKLKLKELPGDEFDYRKMPMVVKTEAELNNAKVRLDRAKGSVGAFAAEEISQRETEHAATFAAHQQSLIDVDTMLATARMRKASLEISKQRLSETKITVPEAVSKIPELTLPGLQLPKNTEFVVASRNVKPGEMQRILPLESSALMMLIIDNPLKLMIQIPERYKPTVKLGQQAEITIDAFANTKFKGTVVRINPAVDRNNRSFGVEIWIDNAKRDLAPGSFAHATIETNEQSQVKLVPKDAVSTYAGVTKIFVARENEAVMVPVKVGEQMTFGTGDQSQVWVAVDGEFLPGDKAIVSGNIPLYDRAPITIRDTLPAAKTNPKEKK